MRGMVIVGCGYLGRRLARQVLAIRPPAEVAALTRSQVHAAELRLMGVTPVLGDLDGPGGLVALPLAGATVFYFVPPPPTGEQDTRMEAFCKVLESSSLPARIVYLSTTGVYGDAGGAWVDETAAARPQSARARRRLDAERRIQAWGKHHGVPVVVLRVPGIYGPGRLPRARLERGEPVLRAEQAPYTNRIHVDDLVNACLAAAERGQAGAAYNVADNQPLNMTEYFNRVAEALRLPHPPSIDLNTARRMMSPAMLAYQLESRRIDNHRMLNELGVTLLYPDLQSGLDHCLEQG